jgi:exopolysaccharide biosynthesis polyprenyl glycosylphosphotransferase
MSATSFELHVQEQPWLEEGHDDRSSTRERAERLLPVTAGICLLAVDLGLIGGAFLVAYWARFVVPDVEALALGVEHYAARGLMVAMLSVLLLALHGLYDEDRPLAWAARVHAIISAVSTALVLTVALSFFFGDHRFSRLWFGVGWAMSVLLLGLWRAVAHSLYAAVRDAIAPANRVLIVGANRFGQELACELAQQYKVVGYADNGSDLDRSPNHPLLGSIAELQRIVQVHAIDEIIIALPDERREQIFPVIARGFRRPVKVKVMPTFGELLPRNFQIQHLGGRPFIRFAPAARVSWLKRASDMVLGSVLLVGLSPVLALIAVAIKFDSKGPIFYRQNRVGKDGRRFSMIKFRSMRVDADEIIEQLRHLNEASGPIFKMRRDPRVTRVGRILRRLSIDELPQLFNVLKGEMSLVGPRPPLPSEVAEYDDWQLGRLRAIPGMTGLWQVSGRSEIPFVEMVRLDLHYIRNWTLGLDIEILLRTLPAVLASRGAY